MSDDAPVFNQFNLVVSDMDATLAFYRRLGLTIPETAEQWAHHHRTAEMPDGLDLDFDSHAFAEKWNAGWPGPGRAMGVLGFRMASREAVDATYADLLLAGYAGQQEPYDASWGARYAIVQDPDGNPVGIMSPVDSEQRGKTSPP